MLAANAIIIGTHTPSIDTGPADAHTERHSTTPASLCCPSESSVRWPIEEFWSETAAARVGRAIDSVAVAHPDVHCANRTEQPVLLESAGHKFPRRSRATSHTDQLHPQLLDTTKWPASAVPTAAIIRTADCPTTATTATTGIPALRTESAIRWSAAVQAFAAIE